jgi:hypothetical protein
MNPKIVYRGLPIMCINLGVTTAIQFGFVGVFQDMLSDGSSGPLSKEKVILSAFLGGIFSGIPCSLLELTMI